MITLNYTVYVDVLFLLNLIVDTLILTSVAILTGQKINRLRFIFASVIGAAYSTLIFFPKLSVLKIMIFKILASVIITIIAFKFKSLINTIKNLTVFYLLTALYGGGIYAFYAFTPTGSNINISNGIYYIDLPLWSILALTFGYYFFIRYALKLLDNRNTNQAIRNIEIIILNKKFTVNALYDSGNNLYDPITMTPVMVVETSALKNIMPKNFIEILYENSTSAILKINEIHPELRVRLIPITDISGIKRNVIAFKAQKISDVEKNKEINNLLIGLTPTKLSHDNSYNALLHSKIR